MLQHYFKTAIRNLQRKKLYASINVIGIAAGLAAFWLIALYTVDELSYDRSYRNADRIYRIAQHAAWEGGSLDIVPVSAPFAPTMKSEFPEVEDAARIDMEGGGMIQYGEKSIRQNDICFADPSLFNLFNYSFLYGKAPGADAASNSIVITRSLAEKIFGDISKALHETIYFGTGNPVVVSAVIEDIPANSHLQLSGIRPLGKSVDEEGWQNFHLYTYLLLKEGADVNTLRQKLPAFAAKTVAKSMGITNYQMELQPLASIHLHSNLDYEIGKNGSISRVRLFAGTGILILLIALINYMNLSTAGAAARVKEIGIRKVVGSARKQLAGLFISEAILVNLLGAVAAIGIVQLLLPFFNQLSGKTLDLWHFGTVNTIGAMLLLAVLTGLASGSYPALVLSRFGMITSLKGQLGNQQNSGMFRKSLVVFQFVIAVCLVSASYIIYQQLQYVGSKDLGFNKEQVLTFHIDAQNVRNQVPSLKQALLKSPLIEAVATAGNPIGNNDLGGHDFAFEKNGVMQPSNQLAKQLFADEDFLATTGMQLLQGRYFAANMPTDQSSAVVINETLMKTLGYTKAVGKRMEYRVNQGQPISSKIIVGVVKDFHSYSLQHKIEPTVMMMPPVAGEQDNLYVKVAKGKAAESVAWLKKVYAAFDPATPIDYHFLNDNFNRQYEAEQRQQQLALTFTVLAFIIACLGLFGLVTFSTAQRTKEIGIRKVLGASVGSITFMLSKDFGKLVAIAAVIASPIAWFGMNQWLREFAYRIQLQWWMFLLSGSVALIVAMVIVNFQAIKAAVANPVKSLRTE